MWFFLCGVVLLGFLKLFAVLTTGRVKSHACLVGKTALVTGGNRGLGYETCLGLAARGCRIIIADKDDAEETRRRIMEETNNENVVTKRFDLTSFKSVRSFAKDILKTEERLDILINNAGIGYTEMPPTEDNNDPITQINHLGGFLLTHLLIDLLRKTPNSRIIFVSSLLAFTNNLTTANLNEKQAWAMYAYGNTKLCNVVTTKVLAKALKNEHITVNAVHPGLVKTEIFSYQHSSPFWSLISSMSKFLIVFPFGKTAQEGAQSALHVAVSKECKRTTGQFFSDCKRFFGPPKSNDEAFCAAIFRKSEQLCGLRDEEKLLKSSS